jgi:ascorbate-specific PTS system EIIC-type component UlaA
MQLFIGKKYVVTLLLPTLNIEFTTISIVHSTYKLSSVDDWKFPVTLAILYNIVFPITAYISILSAVKSVVKVASNVIDNSPPFSTIDVIFANAIAFGTPFCLGIIAIPVGKLKVKENFCVVDE